MTERADYTLITDGRCYPNPGPMYGSYSLRTHTGHERIERREFGHGTSNQAEYFAIIAALIDLEQVVRLLGQDLSDCAVAIVTDSRLVVEQLNGRWRAHDPELRLLRDTARDLLLQFGRYTVHWHSREHSVRILGH